MTKLAIGTRRRDTYVASIYYSQHSCRDFGQHIIKGHLHLLRISFEGNDEKEIADLTNCQWWHVYLVYVEEADEPRTRIKVMTVTGLL